MSRCMAKGTLQMGLKFQDLTSADYPGSSLRVQSNRVSISKQRTFSSCSQRFSTKESQSASEHERDLAGGWWRGAWKA